MSDSLMDAGANGFSAIERFLLRRLLTSRLKTWIRLLESRLVTPAGAQSSHGAER